MNFSFGLIPQLRWRVSLDEEKKFICFKEYIFQHFISLDSKSIFFNASHILTFGTITIYLYSQEDYLILFLWNITKNFIWEVPFRFFIVFNIKTLQVKCGRFFFVISTSSSCDLFKERLWYSENVKKL